MNEYLVYTNSNFVKRVFYALLADFNFFLIVYKYKNTFHRKKLIIGNKAQLRQFIDHASEYLPEDEVISQDLDICFITVPVNSYSFKRLWLIQKQMESLLTDTHQLRSNYFIEEMYDTSICISIYGPITTAYESRKDNEAVILIPSGYGDIFRHAYILQKFIKERKYLSKKLSLLHNNPSSIKISEILFKNCENLYFTKLEDALEQCKKAWFSRIYSMWDIDYLAKTRAKDMSEYLLGYFEKDCSSVAIDYSHTPSFVIRQIMVMKKKTAVIGVQFNTYHHTKNYPRNYPLELAKKYVEICQKNNYAVVNLTGGYNLDVDMDCGNIDILAIPGIVQMLDIVVTIDSFSGHLSGCLNVPCIVLFKEVYAYTMEVLKNNLNIVSKTSDMHSISPEHIFKYTTDILVEKIELPQNVKDEYGILNETNTIKL